MNIMSNINCSTFPKHTISKPNGRLPLYKLIQSLKSIALMLSADGLGKEPGFPFRVLKLSSHRTDKP